MACVPKLSVLHLRKHVSSVAKEVCLLKPESECTACATLNRSFPSKSVFAAGHLRTAAYGCVSNNTTQISKIRILSSLPRQQHLLGRLIAEKTSLLILKQKSSIKEATTKSSKLTK